ncbi:hypothetical protein HDV01_004599 [Terramyces sp. JEL0728]|nr:hypothetical protein HDV01_004599 [Terramyces sp. JEL0728]
MQTQTANLYTTDVYWAVPALQSLISASNKGTETYYQQPATAITQPPQLPVWTPPPQTFPDQNAQINTATADIPITTDLVVPTSASAMSSQPFHLTAPILVGIIIGIVALIAMAVLLFMYCRKRRKRLEEYSGTAHKRMSISDRLSLMVKPTYDEDPFESVPLQPMQKDPKIYVLSNTKSPPTRSNHLFDERDSSAGSLYGPKKYPNQYENVYGGRDFDSYMSKYDSVKRDAIKNSLHRAPKSQTTNELPPRPKKSALRYTDIPLAAAQSIKSVRVETVQTIDRKEPECKIEIMENPFSDEDEFSFIAKQRRSENLYSNYFSDNQSEQQHISQIWSTISRD